MKCKECGIDEKVLIQEAEYGQKEINHLRKEVFNLKRKKELKVLEGNFIKSEKQMITEHLDKIKKWVLCLEDYLSM